MRTSLLISILTIMCISFQNSSAQIDVKGKIKDKSINRADQRTDEGVDKGIDAVEDGVKSLFKKKEKTTEEETTKSEEESSEDQSNDQHKKSQNKPAVKEEQPKLASYTKYDFIPGDQVLLYEDFSQDEIGDFPALWTTNGSGEVRTLNLFPGNWMYMNSKDKVYNLMKDLNLPENYIFEFDVVPTSEEQEEGVESDASFYLSLYHSDEKEFLDDGLLPGHIGFHLTAKTNEWGAIAFEDGNYGIEGSSNLAPIEQSKVNHVILWIQKRRLRVYHKGQKVLDLPTLMQEQNKYNRLRFSLWSQNGLPYITNIRFTTAAPDMRSKLLTEGKLVSYGIYFDVNSDKVKPESAGTLKEIAKVLAENPTVKIKIFGHTDGDGDAAKNLDLSKRRAAAVKSELSSSYGIDASRIETDGKGKTEPIAPNDTPANKAKNRRVEFIKL